MPDRCPRCDRAMEAIAAWWPVKIDKEKTVHVCGYCHREADQIDTAFAEACARAKRIWHSNAKIESVSIWGIDREGTRVNFTGDIDESLQEIEYPS